MKRLTCLLVLLALTGCANIRYTSTTVLPGGATNTVTVNVRRFFWSTDAYSCTINTNGTGTLTASKSTVDAVALKTSGELLIQALTSVKP